MGQRQSKDELVYQQANQGNVESIKALRREGAGLEWMDNKGKTPLIVACMKPELYHVAKALIELGANINAYRPGRHAGTPLHHAAKRGLEQTVKLLLSHQANALVMNDGCQTTLDVARAKGQANIVRAIEAHVCLFSGWLREIHGRGFLELLAPQSHSRKVWVVVVPCGSRNLLEPFKLELAIYACAQDAQPRTIVPLWKAELEEPDFKNHDPAAILSNVSTIPKRWRKKRAIKSSQEARRKQIKLGPVTESEKQQLQWFCDACKGIPQVGRDQFSTSPRSASAPWEDVDLAMTINDSLHSASNETSASSIQEDPSAPPIAQEKREEDGSCTICLDAPVEAACVPCGHLAGCTSCLNELKAKELKCPVCRADIEQVMRIYAV